MTLFSLRVAGAGAAVALVLGACGETLTATEDGDAGDAGDAAFDAPIPNDASNETNDASVPDAPCEGLVSADYDFSAFPAGLSPYTDDGGTLTFPDAAAVFTSVDGARATLTKTFAVAASSASLGYTFETAQPEVYIEMGCYLTFFEGTDENAVSIVTSMSPSQIALDDSVKAPDGGDDAGSPPFSLLSSSGLSGMHRIEVDLPSLEPGAVTVNVKVDGKALPDPYVTWLTARPTTIGLSCGIEFQPMVTSTLKKIAIDDVSVRLCPR